MPSLVPNPNLSAIQQYVAAAEAERGFTQETVLEVCLLLGEEVGELYKAVRKREHVKVEVGAVAGNVEEEMADIIFLLAGIANRYGVDLEAAFRQKEEKNKARAWG